MGSQDIVLVVTGTGFTTSSVISLNNTPEATAYISTTEIHAAVPAAQLGTGTLLNVAVVNGSTVVKADAKTVLSVDNPVPTFTSVAPGNVLLGSTAASVTVNGTNFVPGVALSVNGTPVATTYVSATQLMAALTADSFSKAAPLLLNVINPQPGGGASGTSSLAVNNPAPVIASLSPSTVVVNAPAATVTVSGTGFLPTTVLQVNGATRSAMYVSGTQLTVPFTTADFATVQTFAVSATNPTPGGGAAAPVNLTVTAKPAATPAITSVSPTTLVAGSASTFLTVRGTNVGSTSKVLWNGTPLTTSYIFGPDYTTPYPYVTGYYLSAQLPASLLTTPTSASVTVNTPTAVADSNALTVAVTNPPVPTLTSLSTAYGPIGVPATVQLYGTGFTAKSVVSINGTPYATTFGSSGGLTVTIPASTIALPGNVILTVNTPAPGGGTSNGQTFSAYAPIVSNSMVYNPTNGLLYLSIPSKVGAPYGNTIVSMDPATGALGTPIPVGSEPNKLALTSDGRYLWVGLDGANGVRRIDLTTNTSGTPFALNAGSNGIPVAGALLALPGAPDSVIVLQGNSNGYYSYLAIYDSGVLRGSLATSNYSPYALQVDSTRNEIYVGGSGLFTYTYNASGVTAKASNTNGNVTLASTSMDEMQLVSGSLYNDFGKVYDAEAGTLLSSLYVTGTTSAQGPTFYDTALSKIFVLDNSGGGNYSGYNQIQVFNPADNSVSASVIPVSVPYYISTTNSSIYVNANRLVRWGTNGLALHTNVGVFSLRSNLVKDLSANIADLGVAVTAAGGTTTGTNTTYSFTVTNTGPSSATDVALALQLPASGVLTAATATQGTCSTQTAGCSLGSIASGASVTGTVTVLQTAAGTATLNARVAASTTDNNAANDSAAASVVVTGSNYNLPPTLSSIAPNSIRSGTADTTITLTGTNFVAGSTVMLGSTALTTTYTSATQLAAVVPAANLTSMNWSQLSVSSPLPGGGTSNAVPLTVYSVLSLGVNRMVYDPYSRRLMASVSTGSSATAGSSIVGINPATATIGTPVVLTNVPTRLALSSSGQTLYAANATAASLVRYNMLTDTAETDAVTFINQYGYTFYTPYPFDLAVQPGTENTLAISSSNSTYNFGIFDYAPTTKTFTERSSYSGNYYNSSCFRFLDGSNLFVNNDSNALTYFGIGTNGLASTTGTSKTLNGFSCFKLSNGIAYGGLGGVASVASGGTITQLGSFALPSTYNYYATAGTTNVEPDLSLKQVFFPGVTTNTSYSSYADGLLSFDSGTYLRNGSLGLNIPATEGNSSSYSVVDLYRWGQDGLALLTSGGHIYLVRGPFVVPQLLNTNTAASLSSSSASTVNHGASNTLLTLTGSNFIPGVAVTWNGSYRTTTIVDATHVTVAIPASDLAAVGTASLVATNPGASASSALTITVQ